jgi:flagellar assembly factor FliW
MVVKSARFGPLEVDEKDFLRFPEGLPGFADQRAFVFLPYGPESPFAFLQSVTDPDLVFLIVEPFIFFNDYQFELDDTLAQKLGVSKKLLPQIFTIVTVPDNPEEMTANLLAPVVVNPRKKIAFQIVLEKAPYTTRHRLFPQGFAPLTAKGGK